MADDGGQVNNCSKPCGRATRKQPGFAAIGLRRTAPVSQIVYRRERPDHTLPGNRADDMKPICA